MNHKQAIRLNNHKKHVNNLLNNQFSIARSEDFIYQQGESFAKFTKTWEEMEKDPYYGNNGVATRYRRYSDFEYDPSKKELKKINHRAYYQSAEMNQYVGGVQRHFQDIDESTINNDVFRSLIEMDFLVYSSILPEEVQKCVWQCQAHQIRIELKAAATVEITPEGIHCDGYPFSALHFWGKENIFGTENKLYSSEKTEIACLMFENVLDTVFFEDKKLFHYVTKASTSDPSKSGYRQILAISFSLPGVQTYETVR